MSLIFVKFIIGISPWIMVAGTSFILAWDVNKEFNGFKIESGFDWIIRIIAFFIAMGTVKYYEKYYLIIACIISVNSSIRVSVLFCCVGLFVPITKNMEGTAMWYIPVIDSAVVFVWYVKTISEYFMNFYLDKNYARKIINKK